VGIETVTDCEDGAWGAGGVPSTDEEIAGTALDSFFGRFKHWCLLDLRSALRN
jgi:hypothetical protein